MVDYNVFQILSILEKMTGKQSGYFTTAAVNGNLNKIEMSFEPKFDEKGVSIFTQHKLKAEYNVQ